MVLWEITCGSAALAHHLCGAERPTTYRGGKADYAASITHAAELGRPSWIVLTDNGEWARTFATLHAGNWHKVAAVLDKWGAARKALEGTPAFYTATCDRELYDRLLGKPISRSPVQRAAAHLYLQSRSFRGHPVEATGGRWSEQGFKAEWQGDFRVPRWALAKRLRKLAAVDWPPVTMKQCDVRDLPVARVIRRLLPAGRVVVYFDPPYQGTTGYGPGDLTRADVVRIATDAHAAGADVYVSEAGPVAELVALGWCAVRVPRKAGRVRAWEAGGKERVEQLTCSPGAPLRKPRR